MLSTKNRNKIPDLRISLYQGFKLFLSVLIAGLGVKILLFDIVIIDGDQMKPSIYRGDRAVFFKTPYLPVIRTIFGSPKTGSPAIFSMPFHNSANALRVAGASGDTVSIDEGILFKGEDKVFAAMQDSADYEALPPHFSPRDFMAPFRIPHPGDTLRLSSLSLRDFFFAVSVLHQENHDKSLRLIVKLLDDNSVVDDFYIRDFSLYNGALHSVPFHLRYEWFFWDRLTAYLEKQPAFRKPQLRFTVLLDESEIDDFVVKNSYLFFIADNWSEGMDSRYFGPVRSSRIMGRPFAVVWSGGYTTEGKKKIAAARVGRIIQ